MWQTTSYDFFIFFHHYTRGCRVVCPSAMSGLKPVILLSLLTIVVVTCLGARCTGPCYFYCAWYYYCYYMMLLCFERKTVKEGCSHPPMLSPKERIGDQCTVHTNRAVEMRSAFLPDAHQLAHLPLHRSGRGPQRLAVVACDANPDAKHGCTKRNCIVAVALSVLAVPEKSSAISIGFCKSPISVAEFLACYRYSCLNCSIFEVLTHNVQLAQRIG